MPRITITLDEDTANRLRDAAQREGVPLSQYTARKLRRQLEGSEEFLALAGVFLTSLTLTHCAAQRQPVSYRSEMRYLIAEFSRAPDLQIEGWF